MEEISTLQCVSIGFILFLIVGMVVCLNVLDRDKSINPVPVEHPNQHTFLGCLAILVFLIGVAIVLLSKGS